MLESFVHFQTAFFFFTTLPSLRHVMYQQPSVTKPYNNTISNSYRSPNPNVHPDPKRFELEPFLRANDGKEWLNKVKVKDSNQTYFSYYAPRVAWEDIHRNSGSATGDFIFDVTMNIKDEPLSGVSQVIFLFRCIKYILFRHRNFWLICPHHQIKYGALCITP